MNLILISKNQGRNGKGKLLRPLAFLLVLGGLMSTTSCNMTRGLGRDVEQTGESIQRASRR